MQRATSIAVLSSLALLAKKDFLGFFGIKVKVRKFVTSSHDK